MPKFTPAPWHVRGSSRKGYSQVADDNGEVVATTHRTSHKADAKLIAVSPEMYDLLHDLLHAHGAGGDGHTRSRLLTEHYSKRVRILLGRAK